MRTLDLHGLLVAGAMLMPQTAAAIAGDAFPMPGATQNQYLTLPAIQSAPWWLDIRTDPRVKPDVPVGRKIDLLDPKLLQVAPWQLAGRSDSEMVLEVSD